MATSDWVAKSLSVTSLHLDPKNPRLGRETAARAPRDIIQYLFDHDKAFDVARSIVAHGYFPNEPLLAIRESGRFIVVEGNRRLAALKALREPELVEGTVRRKLERLSRQIAWSDEVEMCADALYLRLTGKRPEEVFPSLAEIRPDPTTRAEFATET